MRKLWRSSRARRLFDELTSMSESNDKVLFQAIATISQSDPIIKLLQQVSLGRMKPTDAGLRAITESWLRTYQKVIESTSLSRPALIRIDPRPRIDLLIETGVLDPTNGAGQFLRTSFETRLAQIPPD